MDTTPHDGPTTALAVERVALVCVILATALTQLVKVAPTDVGWQLATAEWAEKTRHWPATNTFSHTHPDYPLYQQYPALQAALLAAKRWGGWEAISALQALSWTVALLAWIRFAGSWRLACQLAPAWALVLYAVHTRRSGFRPEALTLLLLACQLWMQDRYRRATKAKSRLAWALALVPLTALWANCHQMFALGLILQGVLVAHVLAARHGPSRLLARDDAAVPIGPLLVAFVLSLGACLATPLGLAIVDVPLNMLASTRQFRHLPGHPAEMASILSSPLATALVAGWIVLALLALRRPPYAFRELCLLGLGAMLVAPAVRGLSFCAFLATAAFSRVAGATTIACLDGPRGRTARALASALAIGASASLALEWYRPAGRRVLTSPQPGMGRHDAGWPDRTVAFLAAHRPPGPMLNLSWSSGNWLIPGLLPAPGVFIDARVESYPRDFLALYLAAASQREALHTLLDQYRPGWIVADLDYAPTRRRLAELVREGTWAVVFAEPIAAVLVARGPAAADYLARHELRVDALAFDDAVFAALEPDLAALQRLQAASFLRGLGQARRARELVDRARPEALRYPNVAQALARWEAE